MEKTHNQEQSKLLLEPDLLDEESIQMNITGGLTGGTKGYYVCKSLRFMDHSVCIW